MKGIIQYSSNRLKTFLFHISINFFGNEKMEWIGNQLTRIYGKLKPT